MSIPRSTMPAIAMAAAQHNGSRSAPQHRLLNAGGTIVASMAVYGYLGLSCAVVIVSLILFHECGHYWALTRLGYRPHALRLRPLRGGSVVVSIDEAAHPLHSALVALWGPLFGMTGALLLLITGPLLSWLLAEPLIARTMEVAATVALAQNALNLLPIKGADGSRVLKVVPVPAIAALSPIPIILLSPLSQSAALVAGGLCCVAAAALAALCAPQRNRPALLAAVAAVYGVLCLVGVSVLVTLITVLPLTTWLPAWHGGLPL